MAATQWGPWHTPDPDIVITRHWTDVTGAGLGTCVSRIRTDGLPADVRADVRAYLNTVDLDAVEPEPEFVALRLKMAGRLEDIGRLVAGADPEDFGPAGDPGLRDGISDAHVMQDALAQTLAHQLFVHVGPIELSSTLETQCSGDPAGGSL